MGEMNMENLSNYSVLKVVYGELPHLAGHKYPISLRAFFLVQ